MENCTGGWQSGGRIFGAVVLAHEAESSILLALQAQVRPVLSHIPCASDAALFLPDSAPAQLLLLSFFLQCALSTLLWAKYPFIRLWDKFKASSRNDNLSLFLHGNVVSPDVSNVPNIQL